MIRLILATLLLLSSLLIVFRAPTNFLWYVSILMTEFSLLFIIPAIAIIASASAGGRFPVASSLIALTAGLLFLLPIIQAYHLSRDLDKNFSAVFKRKETGTMEKPFAITKLTGGIGAKKLPFQQLIYDEGHGLALDFYKPQDEGLKPCVIVIHGGSWAGGDSRQLPELNSVLASSGYAVASINYRLAPSFHYPSPVEDLQQSLFYLTRHAEALSIDTSRFVLLGRSAGGQVAMSAAYTLKDARIKGVISFYGPSDMIWGYENPTSPLVLDSRKIMRDYLGGSLTELPHLYQHSSATETASPQSPPTLLIYGENDPLVSHLHATRLSKKLRLHDIPFFELYLPWATHGFDYTLHGPGGQLSTWTVKAFLKAVTGE